MTEEETTTDSPGDNEAAKYRRRLRDVESERDTLSGQLDVMRRAELERIATSGNGPRLHDVRDIWPDGQVDVTELLGDDGRIDESAVRGVIETSTAGRPHLRADLSQRRGDPSQGQGGDGEPSSPSWSEFVRG